MNDTKLEIQMQKSFHFSTFPSPGYPYLLSSKFQGWVSSSSTVVFKENKYRRNKKPHWTPPIHYVDFDVLDVAWLSTRIIEPQDFKDHSFVF